VSLFLADEATFVAEAFLSFEAFGFAVEAFLAVAFFIAGVWPIDLTMFSTYIAELVVPGVGITVQFQLLSTTAQLSPSLASP